MARFSARITGTAFMVGDEPVESGASQPSFGGRTVVGFESRRAEEMARMIARFQGVPQVSPSMREVPLTANAAAVDVAHRLLTGQFDIVILMTGVGFRHWLEAIEKHVPRDRFLASLSDVITIARGPKPVAAMKECGLTPTHRVEEPNT